MRLPNRNAARNQANSEASSPACTWKPRSRGSSSRRTSVLGHRDPLGLADRLAVFVEERGAAVLAQAPAKDADPDLEQNSGQGDMRTANRPVRGLRIGNGTAFRTDQFLHNRGIGDAGHGYAYVLLVGRVRGAGQRRPAAAGIPAHHALAEADAGHLVLALGDAHARRPGSKDIGAALGVEQSRRAQPLGEGLAVPAITGHARIGAVVVDL